MYPPTKQKQTEKRSYFKEAGMTVDKVRKNSYFLFFCLLTKYFVLKIKQKQPVKNKSYYFV